jgi:hypothetical protein
LYWPLSNSQVAPGSMVAGVAAWYPTPSTSQMITPGSQITL